MKCDELKQYLCIEAKVIEYKDAHGYRFTSATKSAPEACMESVYLKSEADKLIADKYKEIRHANYKRCLDKARWCDAECDIYNLTPRFEKVEFYRRWRQRWLELAEKFKHNGE